MWKPVSRSTIPDYLPKTVMKTSQKEKIQMMKINKLIVFILWIFISSLLFCQQTEVIFLQLNDVYEIAPLEGGKVGGLARVATIRKDLMKQYTVVYTILSGDFISP